MSGLVYLIGAGPGDPKLITLKGLECIQKADVIVYDYLADPSLLEYAKKDAQCIYVGKKNRQHHMEQDQINDLLLEKAGAGLMVARLKGGDPLVFGRGGEEAQVLRKAGIPFELVPGVTSAVAVPAYAGIPVTQRGLATSFAIVTGHEMEEPSRINWDGLTRAVDTLTFVMGITHLPIIADKLMTHGRDPKTPVAVIRWGTKPQQETVISTLDRVAEDVKAAGLKPPGIIVVGDVVNLRQELSWFDRKPLFGKRLVTTRPKGKSLAFSQKLADLGAEVIECPAIRTQAMPLSSQGEGYLNRLADYDWLVFTSDEGVKFFFEALHSQHKDVRALATAKVCAVGPATAKALQDHGLLADLIPANYKGEAVASALLEELPTGSQVLVVQPKRASSVIQDRLGEAGMLVNTLRLYETLVDESQGDKLRQALESGVDYITFTSGSTVKNTLRLLGEKGPDLLAETKIACIGPVTAAVALEHHLRPAIISPVYTMDGLLEAILADVNQ